MRDSNFVQGMGRAEQATLRFQQAQGKAATASMTGSKAASRFGVVAQQAGYQVQDFAVQVQGGQSALVALGQQGSQLLGVFGVGGAIAGAVLTVATLTLKMIGLGKATKDQIPDVEQADKAWAAYSKTVSEIRFGNMDEPAQNEKRKRDINEIKKEQALLSSMASDNNVRASNNAEKFAFSAKQFVFPTLAQQIKYEKALADAKAKGESAPSVFSDEFGGGVRSSFYSPISGKLAAESMQNQISARQAELAKEAITLADDIGDAQKKIDDEITKSTQKRDELREQSAKKFQDDQLDFIKKLEKDASRTISPLLTKLQSQSVDTPLSDFKMPETPSALRSNAGASALGGTAVSGDTVFNLQKQTLDVQKQILAEQKRLTSFWDHN